MEGVTLSMRVGGTGREIWGDDKQIKRFTVEWGPITKGGKSEVVISEFQPVAA